LKNFNIVQFIKWTPRIPSFLLPKIATGHPEWESTRLRASLCSGSSLLASTVSWSHQSTDIRFVPKINSTTALSLPLKRTKHSLLYIEIYVNVIYVRPLGQSSGIFVPRYLHANRISDHSVEVWIVSGRTVEEISPQQLSMQWQRWLGFSYLRDIIYVVWTKYN